LASANEPIRYPNDFKPRSAALNFAAESFRFPDQQGILFSHSGEATKEEFPLSLSHSQMTATLIS
jgi:hypothetical protein